MSQNIQNPQNHIRKRSGSQPLAAVLLCVAICFTASCKKAVDMTVLQKNVYENNDFSMFHVSDAWEVTFVYDSLKSFVELEYSAYLEDYIAVKETNDWLSIGFTGKVYPETGSVFKAKVHTSEREHLYIKVENASVITMDGLFQLEDGINMELHDGSVCNGLEVTTQLCDITLTYDSHIYGVKFNGANCTVYATKRSSCKGYFNVEQSFTTDVVISSQLIVFGGSMPSASIEVKEASTINMAQAEVKDMSVYLDGASEATVNVTETLSGFLLSGSTLYYKGHPQINVDCSGDSQLIPF